MVTAASQQQRMETIAILPGGMIHRDGGILHGNRTFADALRTAWRSAQRTSADLGTPLIARVAYPTGQIEARTLFGWERPAPAPVGTHSALADPRWDEPIPDRLTLLGAIRAAQRAGQWPAAEIAAGALAAALRTEAGDHPHTALAIEQQARCAAEARRWDHASALHAEAAELRHRLSSPGDAEVQNTRWAVAAWLQAPAQAGTRPGTGAGFALAHTLIRLCPAPQELGALLRRLSQQLLAQRLT